ncbi:Glycosyl transferase family 1 [Vibrio chagasii]|nr:Glycosyl transferase family 1 [Vibrio chagasii]CAH6797702.1 Glycosyl transferase family 1 [Vibrio chagasii]CAH7178500.1 Glycosyl transferase family 1 [Vibrio chagasii]CAH7409047.1 Glycosyl transferase family 1 [Vibrio chagasii]
MKLLYLHQYFNTPEMSGGTRSYEMAKRLVLDGNEVHVITALRSDSTNVQGDNYIVTNESGINVHWIRVPYNNGMGFYKRVKSFFDFAFKAIKVAKTIEYDLVFATSTPLTIAIPGVYSSKLRKVPMVFEVRDLWPEMPIALSVIKNPILIYIARKLEKFSYKHSKYIIALSPGMKDGVVKTGYDNKRVAVIPNSSDTSEFRNQSFINESFFAEKLSFLSSEHKVVLYAGTLGKLNGVTYLVELAKETAKRDPNIKFLIAGDGADYSNIKKLAVELGVLNNNLYMLGRVAKKDMPTLFSYSDIICSLFIDVKEMQANSANKFFDALAAKKPLLINYGGWHHNLVSRNNIGLSVYEKTVLQSSVELVEFLADAERYDRACVSSGRVADEFFDRDILYIQFSEILYSALNNNKVDVESIAPGEYV